MATQARERGVLALTYAVLVAVGLLSGVIEGFLVPQRVFGDVEGLAVLLAFVGNIGVGVLGGAGTRTAAGAAAPIVGWFVAVIVMTVFMPGGDVIFPGRLPQDPGITHVASAFLIVGVLAGGIAMVVTTRYTKQVNPPTETA